MISAWLAFWVASWVVAAQFADRIPRSSRDDENGTMVVTQLLTATLRSLFVGAGACVFANDMAVLYQCAYAFFAYEVVDLLIGACYKLHTTEMYFHHVLHIVAGSIVWYYNLEELAGPLMRQEMSSIALNAFSYTRNRCPSAVSDGAFVCFALLFYVFRLGGGTLASVRFYRSGTHPLLGHLVLVAAALQWWWGKTITVKLVGGLRRVFVPGPPGEASSGDKGK